MLNSLSVLVLYDHLLTLSDEIRLIWPAKVRRTNTNIPPPNKPMNAFAFAQTSTVKVLFLINRYTVPVCLIMTAYGEDARLRYGARDLI